MIVVFFVFIYYKNIPQSNNVNLSAIVWSPIDQNGWATTTDCRNIKLYFENGTDTSESGQENEQDIAGDPEKKILSIGLNEGLYGPKKRLEVSYAKLDDYKNCSPDVKKLIQTAILLK